MLQQRWHSEAGFRLDIEGDDIDDAALATLSIKDLRLLVVGKVTILNKQIMHERQNRPRQAPTATHVVRFVDLSHTIESDRLGI